MKNPATCPSPARRRARPSPYQHAAEDRALFTQAAAVLSQAAMTDEPHRHSGESDRLLRIASDVSLRAARTAASRDLENTAYDVAACINAARQVPGDAESAQRSTLLAQAAQALAQIADAPVDDIVPPRAALAALQEQMADADRHPNAGSAAQWRELARQANHEVQQLAQVLVRIDATGVEQEHVAVHGMAARIGLLSEIVFIAAALHGESREGWDAPNFRELQAIFHGGLGH